MCWHRSTYESLSAHAVFLFLPAFAFITLNSTQNDRFPETQPGYLAWFAEGVYDPVWLRRWGMRFWKRREPSLYMAQEVRRGTAYIRIQGSVDHARKEGTRAWYTAKKAVKALNAAWHGGLDGMVFYTDEDYVAIPGPGPTPMTGSFDEDTYSSKWPRWS